MMTTFFRKAIRSAAMVAAVALALPAFGQTARARVEVPFAFEAGGRMMPAGEYSFERQSGSWQLTVREASGKQSTVLATPGKSEANPIESKVIFERSGGSYRLAEVQLAGAAYGMRIPGWNKAVMVAQTDKPERIELAMVRR